MASPRRISIPSVVDKTPDGRRIGLLGGSFNPAHEGHVEISLRAMERLKLDAVWWLVSPQNPLKPVDGMAALGQRVEAARRIAGDAGILVTDIERTLQTQYTADTLAALKRRLPGLHFVWLMGADNLVAMHKWRKWGSIFRAVPVAVFARPTYSLRAESARASRRFARFRIKPYRAASLAKMRAPAWVLFKGPLNPVSASKIRDAMKLDN